MAPKVVFYGAVVLALIVTVNGYGSGAPESAKICETMTPGHGVDPQTSDTPFGIQVSSEQVKPGETVTVTILSGPKGPNFKGYLLQGRKANSNDNTPVGTFIPGGDQKGLKCSGIENSSLTHTNNKERKTAPVLWKAPNQPGKYVIYYTVVQDGATYWVAQQSQVITVS